MFSLIMIINVELFIFSDVPVEKQIIPAQVFGGLKNDDDEENL